MSRIHFHDVTAEELLQRAGVALVVRLADPPQRNVHVAVTKKTREGKKCPDFVKPLTRLAVVERLSADGPEPGAVIEVESANASAQLRMHTEYYSIGLSRSPIYDRFEGALLDAKKPVIALLHASGSGDEFAWVVDVSTLPLSKRAQVEKSFAEQRLRPRLTRG